MWDNEGVILIPDHYIFTDDPRANRNVDMLRDYAKKYNIKHFYDIKDRSDFKANPDYKGVCHIALAQVRPDPSYSLRMLLIFLFIIFLKPDTVWFVNYTQLVEH